MSAHPATRPPALALTGLVKRFGPKIAVDDLHLTVRPGCLFGLVGPNGAGKTTTLSMATGLLRPDAGRAEILGRDVWSDPAGAKALIGMLPDGMRLFDRLTGTELLRYVGLLRRVPPADIATRSVELLQALGLADDAHLTVNKNAIPNDPERPMVTSGIRLGSPAMTTRGFGAPEAEQVGHLIADVLEAPQDAANIAAVSAKVADLTRRFPVYG